MKITKANGKAEYAVIENLKKRAGETSQEVLDIVQGIINGVKENGDNAVREYTVRFDGVVPHKPMLTKEELNGYLEQVDASFGRAIINARDNIYRFHQHSFHQVLHLLYKLQQLMF